MSNFKYGRFTQADAPHKQSSKFGQKQSYNNLTRRNIELTENHFSKSVSTSLTSANIKALRMFRYACRMIPFILKIHELEHRVTPVQSKRYLANWFRRYSKESNLETIDQYIDYGYKTVYEAEMNYTHSGYLYQFILPYQTHYFRDHGINRFNQRQANTLRKEENTKFLTNFYQGSKSHAQ